MKKQNPRLFPIDSIKSVVRGKKNDTFIRKQWNIWETWKNNNINYYNSMSEQQQEAVWNRYYIDHVITNKIYITFDKWKDDVPDEIDYVLGRFVVKRITTKLTKLEKREKEFYQCHTCGGIECINRRCRQYNYTVEKISKKNNISIQQAKN